MVYSRSNVDFISKKNHNNKLSYMHEGSFNGTEGIFSIEETNGEANYIIQRSVLRMSYLYKLKQYLVAIE